MAYRFGEWLRDVRTSTIDQTTGRPFTQGRLAELVGVSQSTIVMWESGEVKVTAPEYAVPLADILRRPVSEAMEAIGWPSQLALTDADRRAFAAIRLLKDEPVLLEGALAALEGMTRTLRPQPQVRSRRGRPPKTR